MLSKISKDCKKEARKIIKIEFIYHLGHVRSKRALLRSKSRIYFFYKEDNINYRVVTVLYTDLKYRLIN